MRTRSFSGLFGCAAVGVVGVVGLGATGCTAKPVGELVVVVQTDLSLPKDIDTIRIEAFDEGVPKFQNDYQKLGTTDGEIKLPGTLAFEAPPNPSDVITFTVSARSGGLDGLVRIVREVVTTVPPNRVATLEVPLDFLCDGQAEESNGDAASTCPMGQTCIAGTCTSDAVDSSTLPTYSASQVQASGGSCFDAIQCWTTPTIATVDMTTCTLPPVTGVNIALETPSEGICGPAGCFVTLDANTSPEGWTVGKDGRIVLPPAVCKQLGKQIVAVVTTPTTSQCPSKEVALPTCGPWSNSLKNPAPYTGPVAIAGGQARPTSIALLNGDVYWANGGTLGGAGSVQSSPIAGGAVTALLSSSQAPRSILASSNALLWTDAPAMTGTTGTGSIFQASTTGTVTTLASMLSSPEGLALTSTKLFWSDFRDGILYTAAADGSGPAPLVTGANYPYRLAADDNYVYWTNEGTAGVTPPDGSIARYQHSAATGVVDMVATAQAVPRAIALDVGATGMASAVYWATFEAGGSITRVSITGSSSTLGAPVVLASGLGYPNGLTLDATNVYWTNRTDGTVMMLAKSAPVGTTPTILATGQDAPGSIAVDATNVYWLNEGSSSAATGVVIKLPKGS